MARARKVSNEESKDSGVTVNSDNQDDSSDDSEVRANDIALHSTLDRVSARQNLVGCVVCGEQDIPAHLFNAHARGKKHPLSTQDIPSGYYGCRSGEGFWWPLKGTRKGPCKWLCGTCGYVLWYWGKGTAHGGPEKRLIDRRYGIRYCPQGRYPGHKRYLGKIDSAAGPVVFYHDGAPNPEQPEQETPVWTDEKGQVVFNEKDIQGRAKPEKSSGRNKRATKQL